MLDPISAFSLAAAIIQFVDFSSKVISSAAELHHSSSGALANNLELSTIVSDLSAISNDLKARNPHQGKHSYNKDELVLISLASQCKELSDKLLHDLDGLNIKGSHTLWASARQSIRSLWKESYISDISKRLDGFRSQLMLRLLALLNDRDSATKVVLMELRCCQGPHIGTFDWIFDPLRTGFMHWLREGGDIYWINGNAGSGKSTLMKYLVGHDFVKNALVDWAGTKPLFIGNYYFWSAGNEIEKSQQGLLQSLLYDILGNCPSVLPKLFPDRWASPNHAGINMDGSWSQAELVDAFNQLTKKQVLPGKFVFFIDGVDEYMGDPSEIARLLKAFATSVDVKLIVSGRPWTEIEIFLNPIPGQSLTLQDFTREDIKHYIYDLITEHPGFRNTQIDERYNNLIAKISDKSGGAFLWVVLAVREMLKGLAHEDTVSELEARLQDIPPGLEEFFERILDSIEKPAEPLPLLTVSFLEKEQKNPNYVIAEEINPWTTDHMEKELETLKRRVKARCRDFLQIVRAGLPISSDPDWRPQPRVEFLHRTVRDFFLEYRNQTLLHDWMKYSHNPHLSLCRSFAMQMKVLPISTSASNFYEPISSCLYQAQRIEISCETMLVSALIEELDRIATFRSCLYGEVGRKILVRSDTEGHWERGSILAVAVRYGTHSYVRQKLLKNPAMVNNLYWHRYLLHYALFDSLKLASPVQDDFILMVRILLEAGADQNRIENHNQLDENFGGYRNTIWAAFIHIFFHPDSEILRHRSTPQPVVFRVRTEMLKLLLEYGADRTS
ncbi:hypothetical protein EAF04_005887 [Stromatinia cepivora]|nr:hypothetical protein EAF04_005887 [Stromatinia cepivora]